jgi:hypothetical protein
MQFFGYEITIPLIYSYKEVNIMSKHIKKFIFTESKNVKKIIRNFLSETVVPTN